jgi:hypothetical protein
MQPSFEQVIEFIREWTQTPHRKLIKRETRLEDDLGVTGDDGIDLLKAIEHKFDMHFEAKDYSFREAFNLGPNEYLFHSEGYPAIFGNKEFTTIFGPGPGMVRSPTVGELYEAIQKVSA